MERVPGLVFPTLTSFGASKASRHRRAPEQSRRRRRPPDRACHRLARRSAAPQAARPTEFHQRPGASSRERPKTRPESLRARKLCQRALRETWVDFSVKIQQPNTGQGS